MRPSITRPIFVLACIATGILLCPILRAEPQESSQPGQKAQEKSASVPVMEADPSAQYLEKGFHDPQVTVESYVSLNGTGSQLYIDSSVNLADEKESWFAAKKWILPYKNGVAK